MKNYELSQDQRAWASKRRWDVPARILREALVSQRGKCALSGVTLRFDVSLRTSEKDGIGCHPLTPAVHVIAADTKNQECQIICYGLYEVKGDLPDKCFRALIDTPAWKRFMKAWAAQAKKNPRSRKAFQKIRMGA